MAAAAVTEKEGGLCASLAAPAPPAPDPDPILSLPTAAADGFVVATDSVAEDSLSLLFAAPTLPQPPPPPQVT